jgi:hypothetical protein
VLVPAADNSFTDVDILRLQLCETDDGMVMRRDVCTCHNSGHCLYIIASNYCTTF